MIILREISLRRGSKQLLTDISITLQPAAKIALIGANGSGKSSLFALLLGELSADHGHIEGIQSLRIAHMAQEVAAVDMTAGDYVLAGDIELASLLDATREAELRGDYAHAATLHSRLEERGDGYHAERRVGRLLDGLGFASGDAGRAVREFSGGWRIRLNLARALMCPSELLLLDEPSNHLDLDATLWLQNWLRSYTGTLVLISHDRDFIDGCCEQTLHLEHTTLTAYAGNYSAFERQRAERLANQQAAYEKQQRRIGEIEGFVARFRAQATKARQAQSRLRELERMQRVAPAHVDSPFYFSFPPPERTGDPLLRLDHAVLGYGEQAVLRNVNLALRPGSRLGLLGRNGAGKSTLLKSLVGALPLLDGNRQMAQRLSIGYFDQQQLEALDLNASPAQHLQRLRPTARDQEILDFLGGFAFGGPAATATVAPFSGGEKARLALALLAWQRPAVLILDEPTNHLDLEMRHALMLALQDYAGAVLLVTHDRHLLRHTADELWLVHEGRVGEFAGDLRDYERLVLQGSPVAPDAAAAAPAAAQTTQAAIGATPDTLSSDRKQQRQHGARQREALKPLQQRVRRAEQTLEHLQAALAECQRRLQDESLYQPEQRTVLSGLLQEEGQLRQVVADAEETWLDAQLELETQRAVPNTQA